MQISRTRHHFVVFTDDLSKPYCSRCECRLYTRPEGHCREKNVKLCGKLSLFVRLLDMFHEFVLLDSDLLILKDTFLDRLSIRSKAHDFLASYAHLIMRSVPQSHFTSFNSGLLFIRRLPGLDYNDIWDMWRESRTNNDQIIISKFIFERYNNWDTLSWKWHCRYLQEFRQDIPFSECYTIHDRHIANTALKELNLTLLKVS